MVFISLWIIAGLVFLLLEALLQPAFFFLSFACGAFGAWIAAFFDLDLFWQLTTAGLVSIAALITLTVFVRQHKFSTTHAKPHVTNVDALVGKTEIIEQRIGAGQVYQIKFCGEIWSCKNIGSTLVAEDHAVVVRVEGNRLLISKVVERK